MSDSQVQNENTEPTKKVTKPRKPRAEASSSKSSTPKKSTPKKSSSSKASTPKKSTPKKSTPKKSNPVDVEESSEVTTPSKAIEKTIEEVYQKKTQLEHVLLRPDTYVGSVEPLKEKMWVYDSEKQGMVYRDITYVPGLYKIVDEILVNAADNKVRDPTMNTIKVNINKEEGTISIYNNGKGIPIEIHKEEKIWVPELIFGHLLTSSNYDDSEKKVTGGRNGYGAKLANIFSTEFIVETTDSSVSKKYRQIFRNNMSVIEEPKLTSYSKKDEYTMITFKPDFEKFNMSQFDDDITALLKKRVYDMVACVNNIKVYLNNEKLKLKDFKEYMQLYLGEREEPRPDIVYERVNNRWEIGVLPSSESQFLQISFVNSICTSKGGTHVNYIADQLADRILSAVKSKKKDANIKKNQVKNHMWIFVKCLIENPTFDSQTKENLTLKVTSFGSSCNPSDAFFKGLLKCGIVDQIIEVVDFKLNKELKKTDGKKSRKITGITKLDDANNAGGRNAKDCTLILTEGDSAKSLAVAGLSEVGRDYYGVFPLRGKLLNVRDGSHKQIMNNAEIQHIKQILGLKQGKEYESTSELRYGHLMIMTDQDHDGSHIKGLIINFMDHFFPSLLRIKGFLLEFITPIVKCTKGEMELSFFTVPEFEKWKETIPDIKNWKIKYYKGLGTSSSAEAKKYFRNLNRHKKPFRAIAEGERELIDMAFNKKKADDRKEWLKNYEPGTYMNHDVNEITITDFINKELILFSRADNERSIPNVLDGLKPGQRKVLYTCFKKNFKNEVKVSSLSGAVLAEAAYHHGDASLQGTIIAMAHDFVGSNNINVLHGEGQFGTRAQGGKDAASARYISVTIPPLTRKIFHPQDDALLTYCNDDGQFVEPEWYLPILPMILVNGSEGIGTGWSSYIPNYNPRDIVDNLKRLINNEEPVPMHPWYRGFQGEFEQLSNDRYQVNGIIQKVNDESVRITELPVRVWTQSYKEQLEKWIAGTERTSSWIREYKENHTTTAVDFTVKLSEDNLIAALKEGLEKKFKTSTAINTSNMVCFDGRGRIRKYNSPEEILKEFYDYRLEYYHKRKAHMIKILEIEVRKLRNKAKFLQMKIDHNLEFEGLLRNAIIDLLEKNNFERFADDKDIKDNDDEDFNISHNDHGYDYLMKSPAWSFCMEEVQKLLSKKVEKENELEDLRKKTPQRMWIEDLNDFLAFWDVSIYFMHLILYIKRNNLIIITSI
ncbi:DNA topoisomerase II [Rhizophagus irregularis]|uniref:DNA topoisomerase 2 n=1 Tax=Rhizophagus irregularis TaxID=588596 RepID=A0A2I1FYC1_9GLOM|nr:DNA topoisomerase II [Rhizophagus irregularis]